jgi:hypothetical protein
VTNRESAWQKRPVVYSEDVHVTVYSERPPWKPITRRLNYSTIFAIVTIVWMLISYIIFR